MRVGPFRVADLDYRESVDAAVGLVERQTFGRFYALHVGGLTHRRDAEFVDEMNDADVVCADGGSVVLLARLAGARYIERAPTTDLGWDLIRGAAERLGRKVRVAMLGGPDGLAERAAARLEADAPVEAVYVTHGFHSSWDNALDDLRDARPDVCIVGMGAPLEMLWVREHRELLPDCALITCGGWFGFLAGEEERAPTALRRAGLEWISRVAQDPRRLGPRYLRGAYVSASIGVRSMLDRRMVRK